jgi:hypothetical protein
MFKPYRKKIFSGEDDRHIMFLISPISSYCYDLMQLVSEYQALAPELC